MFAIFFGFSKFKKMENYTIPYNKTFTCQQSYTSTIPDSQKPLLAVMLGAIAITATSLNVLVLVTFISSRSLSKPCNKLLLSLAITDFMVGAVVVPQQLVNLFISKQCQPKSMLLLTKYLVIASCGNLCSISYDRWLFFTKQTIYAEQMRGVRFYCTISMPFFMPLIIILFSYIYPIIQLWMAAILFLAGYLLYLSCYTCLYLALSRRKRFWRNQETGSHTQIILKQTQKSMRLISALIICNFLCTAPAFVYRVLIILDEYLLLTLHHLDQRFHFKLVAAIMVELNSSLNPVLFFIISSKFCSNLHRIVGICVRQIYRSHFNRRNVNSAAVLVYYRKTNPTL